MDIRVKAKIDNWKKRLLDFSKQNVLINLRKTTLKLTAPGYQELYKRIVDDEQFLAFPFPARSVQNEELEEDIFLDLREGDISTNIEEVAKLQKTLRKLRNTARTHNEERGVNALYLSFGTLEWKEKDDSEYVFHSPVILVPASLTVANIKSPFKLSLGEEEIVLNPTLVQKMFLEFGLELPDFKSDKTSIEEYLDLLQDSVKNKQWAVHREVSLAIMSFQKINMYKDLDKHGELIERHPMLAALAGMEVNRAEGDSIDNYIDYHHDDDSPMESFQIVDADSSQMDAIKLARKGFSFVLQGPPGTGKSQTITNIIAEALADGKKVLFVSEKMAALQVVYNRMAAAKLSDFCLSMHDAKMKKTEFLQDLKKTLHADRKRLSSNKLSILNNLKVKRADINEYPEQLHTTFSKLDITPYFANGKLADLEYADDIPFPINKPEEWTQETLSNVLNAVSHLQAAIDGAAMPIPENPWSESIIDVITNDQRQTIDSTISSLKTELERLSAVISRVSSSYGLSGNFKLNEVEGLSKMLHKAADSPLFKREWLDMDVDSLNHEATSLQRLSNEYINLLSIVRKEFKSEVLCLNIKEIKATLETSSEIVSKNCKVPSNLSCGDFIDSIFSHIQPLLAGLSNLYNSCCDLSSHIGAHKPERIEDLSKSVSLSRILYGVETKNIPSDWLTDTFDTSYLNSLIDMHNQINIAKDKVLIDYDREILSLDYLPMLQAFRTSYSGFFGKLKSGYRNDIKRLKAYRHNSNVELDSKEAIRVLELVKAYKHKLDDVLDRQAYFKKTFGPLYIGLQTDWNTVKRLITTAEKLHEYFNGLIPQNARISICSGEINNDVIGALYTDRTLETNKQLIDSINGAYDRSIEDTLSIIKDIKSASDSYRKAISQVSIHANHPVNDYELNQIVDVIVRLDNAASHFTTNNDNYNDIYGSYYTGLQTDWQKILSTLEYLSELKDIESFSMCSPAIKDGISSSLEFADGCRRNAKELDEVHRNAIPLIKKFTGFFADNVAFSSMPLSDFAKKIEDCEGHKESLQDWINFKNAKHILEKFQLEEYVSEVIKRDIRGQRIADAFEKRFYNLWLDAALEHFAAVQNFQGARHNEKIDEFKSLDKQQFGIAIARIREMLFQKMPNIDRPTVAESEITTLKQEMNKQRRIMPLRKLFSEIPNIIMDIKPCFMMSPLSVSVLLNADTYNFDLVIFDEASQVCTEDAVGAIMRGKQIIIVGDSNQLPPTNFFKANANTDPDDFDEDEDDAVEVDETISQELDTVQNTNGAYQSILEEAMTVLNNQSLRWHYRSRHEDLIAFSNYKIYGGDLITFPSSSERTPDNGVEFIKVNGVYGYGGKRVNKEEAQKVADLVFEHFRKYPERSLGIIANSVAQQDAIDAAIRKKRQEDESFEEFFMEERHEPFFIKSLETVQGDERDTIIFSIGYGKDANGKMHMNFGPLNSADGHRRLNVAVTRAKYNLKLVGSIQHTDIDTSRTSNRGVGLMRSYIEFAMRGVAALDAEISINNDAECESPFEQSVYDFLRSKEYEVVRQVGCSGYRIDLAVKHPEMASKFVLAIECDGATYHSSRTARERDRLRQEVLESMGWTFHRIWSTDWVKNPTFEKRKLIEAIEKALEKPLDTPPTITKKTVDIPEETIEPEYEVNLFSEEEGPDYYNLGFKPYSPATTTYKRLLWAIVDMIKKEQPLSLYTLCKGVAHTLDRQKVTEAVKTEVIKMIDQINYHTSFRDSDYQWRMITNNAKIVIDDDNNVYYDSIDHVDARISDPDDENRRDIENIPTHEIWKALHLILSSARGVTKENAVTAVARAFGYKSTRQNIRAAINLAIDKLMQLGLYSMVDEKLTPVQSAIDSSKFSYIFK